MGAFRYIGIHMCEYQFQKYPLKQVRAFLKKKQNKTKLNKNFVLIHIKFDPLNLPDLNEEEKIATFSWKSTFLDPLDTKCRPTLFIPLQKNKRPLFTCVLLFVCLLFGLFCFVVVLSAPPPEGMHKLDKKK